MEPSTMCGTPSAAVPAQDKRKSIVSFMGPPSYLKNRIVAGMMKLTDFGEEPSSSPERESKSPKR